MVNMDPWSIILHQERISSSYDKHDEFVEFVFLLTAACVILKI